jgi:hypothetical protein
VPAPRADINRDAVAASVAMVGQRETARRLNVPLGTVQRIAKEAGAVPPRPVMQPQRRTTAVASVRGTVGTPPAHVLISDEIQRNGATARLAMSQIAARTLPHVAGMALESPEMALEHAGNVASVVGSAQRANVPGFERQQDQQSATVVNIALLGVPPDQQPEQLDYTVMPGTTLESGDPGSV